MADRQAFYSAAWAAGDKEAVFPTWETIQQGLDEDLAGEDMSPDLRLLQELGVA